MAELTRLLGSSELVSPLNGVIGGALLLLLLLVPVRGKKRGLVLNLDYWKPRVPVKSGRLWVMATLVTLASVPLVGGMGEPQTVVRQTIPVYAKPAMIVLDISGSMGAKPRMSTRPGDPPPDVRTNFDKARDVYTYLIDRKPIVNFGLLLFSTENYIARYFSYKNELLRDTLENKDEISFMSTGTRIAEAVSKAHWFISQYFPHKRGDEPDKSIVLVSDLDADAESLAELADEIERARWDGIKVYVILMDRVTSTARPAPVPALKVVNTVGMNDKEGINDICEQIAATKSSPVREEERISKRSWIPFLVPVTLALLFLSLFLSATFFRKIP